MAVGVCLVGGNRAWWGVGRTDGTCLVSTTSGQPMWWVLSLPVHCEWHRTLRKHSSNIQDLLSDWAKEFVSWMNEVLMYIFAVSMFTSFLATTKISTQQSRANYLQRVGWSPFTRLPASWQQLVASWHLLSSCCSSICGNLRDIMPDPLLSQFGFSWDVRIFTCLVAILPVFLSVHSCSHSVSIFLALTFCQAQF